MRQGGQNHAQMRMLYRHQCERLPKDRGQAGDFRFARTGQAQDHRALRLGKGTAFGIACPSLCHHRMAHKVTGHPRRCHIGRLKRQQGQHMVDPPRHLRRPLWPPCPNRGGDIMDRAQIGLGGFDQFCHAQAEIGAVDGDQRGRLCRHSRLSRLGDAAFEGEVFRQHLCQPHHRQFLHREQRCHPLRLHQGATDAAESHRRVQLSQARHQGSAKFVARRLSGDQKKGQRAHRNRPVSAAMDCIWGRSRQITDPA